MITALEAKQKAFCKKPYYEIVENKINEAASNGELVCAIRMEEITDGTILNNTPFGFHTAISAVTSKTR